MDYKEQIKLFTNHVCRANLIYGEYAKFKGISYNRLMVYYALKLYSPCTQKNIVQEWGISKQTVNSIVKTMLKDRLIEFVSGNNNKEKLIELTKKGKDEINEVVDELMDLEESSLTIFSEEEIYIMIKNMGNLSDNFERKLKERMMNKNG